MSVFVFHLNFQIVNFAVILAVPGLEAESCEGRALVNIRHVVVLQLRQFEPSDSLPRPGPLLQVAGSRTTK